jgi:aconitate hydratase
MGVLPLEFIGPPPALTGEEVLDIKGLATLVPGGTLRLRAGEASWPLRARLDNPQGLATWRAGGILPEMIAGFTTETTP